MNDTRPAHGAFDVERRIPLGAVAVASLQEAVQQLRAMESVSDAQVDKQGRLRVAYDASRIGMREIEEMLDHLGIALAGGFWSRQKLAWYRFLDENAKANAHAGSGACCNRPPPVPHHRDK
jgi:hypothetical protein